VKRIDGALWMCHKPLAGAPVEWMEVAETAPCSHRVLHHPPAAFDRVEVMAAVGGEEMALQGSSIMRQRRGKFLRPMDATAIHHHTARFVGVAKEVPDVMKILAQGFGVKMRHDLREDLRGARLDGTHDAAPHPPGAAAPRAILAPRLACAGCVAFDLALTQGAGEEASPRGCAPPPTRGRAKRHRLVSSS
jgi:hypothetical protein